MTRAKYATKHNPIVMIKFHYHLNLKHAPLRKDRPNYNPPPLTARNNTHRSLQQHINS